MKKAFIVILTIALSTGAFAQTLAQVAEIYNNGATALQNGDKAAALDCFNQALDAAGKLGDEGAEISGKCKDIIPNIFQSMATDLFKEGKVEDAIASLKNGIAAASVFGNDDYIAEAKKLLSQFLTKYGSDLLTAGNLTGAKEALLESVTADPTNAASYLKLGQSAMKGNDFAAAEDAFKKAAELGQEKIANKQLCNIYLKQAAASLKAKNYSAALEKAKTAVSFNENPTAYKIAGNCAAQLKDYKGAVEYFSKYLQLSPNAADAATVKANIEAFKKL